MMYVGFYFFTFSHPLLYCYMPALSAIVTPLPHPAPYLVGAKQQTIVDKAQQPDTSPIECYNDRHPAVMFKEFPVTSVLIAG
jgi:hypothetical protein